MEKGYETLVQASELIWWITPLCNTQIPDITIQAQEHFVKPMSESCLFANDCTVFLFTFLHANLFWNQACILEVITMDTDGTEG